MNNSRDGAGGRHADGAAATAQLALNLRLRDGSSLDNFYPGENSEALERLRALLTDAPAAFRPPLLYLWGEPTSGKTHLLEAACRAAQAQGPTFYLSLDDPALTPDVLDEVEHSFLICLDDVQSIAGNIAWESALFARYELACATGARLLAAAAAAPAHLGLKMPELATRLGAGPVYQLHPLSDADKLEAMRLRARRRGLDMSADVARYILHRYPRDLKSLFALLERIDSASLARQRRITIPFVQQLEVAGGERPSARKPVR